MHRKDDEGDHDDAGSSEATDSDTTGDSKGVTITDEDMGMLFSRLKEMKEWDVELDKTLAMNWKTGRCEHEVLVKANTEVRLVEFNGDMLAFGTEEGDLYVISMSTADVINAYEGHDGEVTSMAFDGEFLITGGADRTVKVHRNTISPGPGPQRLGECLHTWKGHTERVIGVVRPEGTRQVVSAAPDAKLIFWDLDTGEKIRELELPAPILCLGAAEGYLAVGMMNGNVSVFTDKTGEEVLTWQAYQRAAVRSIYFPSQTRIMTGGGNGVVRFWDLKEGGTPDGGFYSIEGRGIAHEYKGHNAPVVALQGDEVKIVSAASDGVVRVFDMKMGEELFRIEGHSDDIRSLQFDRRFLITDGTMNTIVVHDFASEEGSDEFEIEGFELEDE